MAHILLAEDDETMLNFLVLALQRAGHSVVSTRDGGDAFQKLEEAEGVDLLLTDIVMPGMDGIELAQKAGEKFPDVKVMFITGFAAIAMQGGVGEDDGTTKLLSKPFHLNDLVEQVELLLSV